MIALNDDLYLFSGSNRRCFLHPADKGLCIKVLLPESDVKTQRRETAYFRSLNRRISEFKDVAPLIDTVRTSFGQGSVFPLVRDFDGGVSKTLDHYLRHADVAFNEWAIEAIDGLRLSLYRQAIVFRDLNTLNILVQRISEEKQVLIVVDGIGHNDFLRLVNISRTLARKKIARTWNRKMNYWFARYPEIFPHVQAFEV